MNIAVIFAGGVGRRMSSRGLPKQFLKVNNVPIIIHTLNVFQACREIDKIYVAIVASHKEMLEEMLAQYGITKVAGIVIGGETGLDSIYNGLARAQKESPEDSIVLIHDGVRPIITEDIIRSNIECVHRYGSAITSTPCYETICVSSDESAIEEIPSRKTLFKAQAPQSFYLKDIIACHEKLRSSPEGYGELVDSCSLYAKVMGTPHMVRGVFGNIKVTTPEDVYVLKALLDYRDAMTKLGLDDDLMSS